MASTTYPSVPVDGLRLRMHERESRLVCLCKVLGTRVRYGKDTQRGFTSLPTRGAVYPQFNHVGDMSLPRIA